MKLRRLRVKLLRIKRGLVGAESVPQFGEGNLFDAQFLSQLRIVPLVLLQQQPTSRGGELEGDYSPRSWSTKFEVLDLRFSLREPQIFWTSFSESQTSTNKA